MKCKVFISGAQTSVLYVFTLCICLVCVLKASTHYYRIFLLRSFCQRLRLWNLTFSISGHELAHKNKMKRNGNFNSIVREGRYIHKKVNIAKNSFSEVFKKEAIIKIWNMLSFWQSARRPGWMSNPVRFAGFSCFPFWNTVITHTVNSPVHKKNKKTFKGLNNVSTHTYSLFPPFHFAPAASKSWDAVSSLARAPSGKVVNVVVGNVRCGVGTPSSLFLKWRTFVWCLRNKVKSS